MASPWPPQGSPSARLLQSLWVLLLSQLPHRSCPTSSLVPLEVGAGIPIVHVSLPHHGGCISSAPSLLSRTAPSPGLLVSTFQRPFHMAPFLRLQTASLPAHFNLLGRKETPARPERHGKATSTYSSDCDSGPFWALTAFLSLSDSGWLLLYLITSPFSLCSPLF